MGPDPQEFGLGVCSERNRSCILYDNKLNLYYNVHNNYKEVVNKKADHSFIIQDHSEETFFLNI